MSHMGPSTDRGGGARGAPLWPLTFFSDVGPGRVKEKKCLSRKIVLVGKNVAPQTSFLTRVSPLCSSKDF